MSGASRYIKGYISGVYFVMSCDSRYIKGYISGVSFIMSCDSRYIKGYVGGVTFIMSTPVRALTVTGSSASSLVTSPFMRLLSPLMMMISLVLASGAATLAAI